MTDIEKGGLEPPLPLIVVLILASTGDLTLPYLTVLQYVRDGRSDSRRPRVLSERCSIGVLPARFSLWCGGEGECASCSRMIEVDGFSSDEDIVAMDGVHLANVATTPRGSSL